MKVTVGMTKTNLFYEPELKPFEFTTDHRGSIWGEAYFIHNESFDDLKFRRNLVFFCGGLQFDKYGNSNLIGIGKDYKQLKFRGPGGIGVGDMCAFCKWYYLYTASHDKRIFVDKVDYITCFGWGDGGADARKKIGLPGGGPRYCITPLCIMDFDDDTKRMKLKSVHPGVTVEDVIQNTGFELIIPDDVPTTDSPTEEEMKILRERVDVEGFLRK
jgi:glutaconate CoA-transferase subunit B